MHTTVVKGNYTRRITHKNDINQSFHTSISTFSQVICKQKLLKIKDFLQYSTVRLFIAVLCAVSLYSADVHRRVRVRLVSSTQRSTELDALRPAASK